MTKDETKPLGDLYFRASCVVHEVYEERLRQIGKWGDPNHPLADFLAILMEEVGEVAQAINGHRFGNASIADVRAELIQTAAVAVAMAEIIPADEKEASE